jgi:secreted trypsin-like serine protease
VGYLVVGNYAENCTASLIQPQVVLTAAHCVYYTHANIWVWLAGAWYAADRWFWNDGYDPNATGLAPEGDADVAVVHLTRPVSGISPLRLTTRVPKAGDTFTVVGFGETSSGERDYGTKRWALATVGQVEPSWFLGSGGSSPCHGDSGGPAIASDGSIVGVFARMHDACNGGSDSFAYKSVAPVRGWITSQF